MTREQRLLNPHLILRDVIRRPSLASTAPTRSLRGRPHRILVVRDDVAPIRLYVDARTGRIDRLTTLDHNYNRGDVTLVVDYSGWRSAGSGVRFARTVTLREDGETLHTETHGRPRQPRSSSSRTASSSSRARRAASAPGRSSGTSGRRIRASRSAT